MEYKAESYFENLLSTEKMAPLSLVFTTMLKFKYALWALNKVGDCLKGGERGKGETGTNPKPLKQLHKLRHEMVQVVSSLERVVHLQLLEVPSLEEISQRDSEQTLEEILLEYGHICFEKSLQHPTIQTCLENVLQLSLDLHHFVKNTFLQNDNGTTSLSIKKLKVLENKFSISARRLVIDLERNGMVLILQQINFNGYYSVKFGGR